MKAFRRILILLAGSILLLFTDCNTPVKIFESNSNGWLPSNFNPKTGTLLIQTATSARQQLKIEEFMKENYPYSYEFTKEDIETIKTNYTDRNKYQFVLLHNTFNKSSGSMVVSTNDYNFFDLGNSKVYPRSGVSASWASMVIKMIITKILKDNP